MKTKYAINSKEFRLAIFIIIATFLAKFTGYQVETDLLDKVVDVDWSKWGPALTATAFAIIRYFFTSGKIIGLFPKKKPSLRI
jgi:hypothetical protein